MKLRKRQKWMLTAAAAGWIGARVTDAALAGTWRAATRKDPPDDPTHTDVGWRTALLWSAAAGAVVAVADVAARRGAAVAWRRVTGRKPPQPKHRRHRPRR
jgi:hypothetical protein